MPLSLADVLSAQAGGGPVYEGGPDANVTPGGVLAALGLGGPSWLDAARKQTDADIAAYQRGGVPELMADTGQTQELAGGFGGTTTGKGIRGFHGTPAEFEKFNTPAYFSTNKEYAGKFAQGGRTIEADLTPQNPWWTQDQLYLESLRSNPENVAALRAKGHDAAIFSSAPGNTDPILQLGGYSYPQIAMFDPAQIARVPQGIRAYHGSPYDFEKFDISKIGTGEGAQAYGHGLYFAENPAVAQEYKNTLARSWKNYQRASDNPGKMYEVNINAEPGQFLNWDAPLSEQQPIASTVERTISQLPDNPQAQTLRNYLAASEKGTPGSAAYRELANRLGTEWSGASSALREAGIPGIRYLDQGSRGSNPAAQADLAKLHEAIKNYAPGTAEHATVAADIKAQQDFLNRKMTSNYVVFNPEIVDILKKYGLAGLTMGGVLSAAGQEPAPSQ